MDNTGYDIGKKIKELRKKRKITQSDLAGNLITRNMLSQIENGIAFPSLQTLLHIAKGLSVPVGYLLSDDTDLLFYEKKEVITEIRRTFKDKNYKSCRYLIEGLSGVDDELAYILSVCHYEMGKKALIRGSLSTASREFSLAVKFFDLTVYPTDHIRAAIPMYSAVAENIQSPLLEFNEAEYLKGVYDTYDYEFYKYMTMDYSYPFKTMSYKYHMDAKALIKDRKYSEAISFLLKASELAKGDGYNAFLIFGVYTDLEYCYKSLADFENAYSYSSKRLSLTEGFKS